jgi:hypothetical protein
MGIVKIVRGCLVVALALLAVSCATSTPPQGGSDDNGANCGGTPINKQSCIDNQHRM